ncbi:hypothetical protein TB2_013187 [Malus domestica]
MDYKALNDNDAYVPKRKLACPSVTTSEIFVNLLGSCNRLVCLAIEDSDDYANIILWNPSTGDTTVLPKPPFNKRFYELGSDDKLFYGLGYDSYNEDYKACFLNGALHWVQPEMMSSIISFDLADEKLAQTLPLPDSNNGEVFVGVGTTGNCLFTFTIPIDSIGFQYGL